MSRFMLFKNRLTQRALDGGYGAAFMDSLVTPPPVTHTVRRFYQQVSWSQKNENLGVECSTCY